MNDTELSFTLDELIAAMQGAAVSPDAPDAVRLQDIREVTGWSEHKVATGLRRLKDAGVIEVVKVPFERIDGVVTKVSAYRMVRRD